MQKQPRYERTICDRPHRATIQEIRGRLLPVGHRAAGARVEPAQHLELTTGEPEEVDDETIKIELPLGNKKVYNSSGQTVYVCNTLWRNRLSEEGQYRVKRFFENEFKSKLRTYVDAYIEKGKERDRNGKDRRVKEAITAFFIQYHIDFTKKDLATMARDWYRHRDKVDENKRSPLVC